MLNKLDKRKQILQKAFLVKLNLRRQGIVIVIVVIVVVIVVSAVVVVVEFFT